MFMKLKFGGLDNKEKGFLCFFFDGFFDFLILLSDYSPICLFIPNDTYTDSLLKLSTWQPEKAIYGQILFNLSTKIIYRLVWGYSQSLFTALLSWWAGETRDYCLNANNIQPFYAFPCYRVPQLGKQLRYVSPHMQWQK